MVGRGLLGLKCPVLGTSTLWGVTPSQWKLECCGQCLAQSRHDLGSPGLLPPQDQKRMEKISKRVSAIEEVNNNVKLLTEMVMSHSQGGASARSSEDLMKVWVLVQVQSGFTGLLCPAPTLTWPPPA